MVQPALCLHAGRDLGAGSSSNDTPAAVLVEGEKAPQPQEEAPRLQVEDVDAAQVAAPPAPPIGGAATEVEHGAEPSPVGTLRLGHQQRVLPAQEQADPAKVTAIDLAASRTVSGGVGGEERAPIDHLLDGLGRALEA